MKYLLLLIPLLVLAACAQTQDTAPTTRTCPDGTIVGADEDCPTPQQQAETQQEDIVSPKAGDDPYDVFRGDRSADESTYDIFRSDERPSGTASAELDSLIERAEDKTARGYSFTYDERIGPSTLKSPLQASRVAVREDAVAIELAERLKTADSEATHVLITPEGAVASCPECRMEFSPIPVDAEEYDFTPPLAWLNMIEDDVFGDTLSIDGRSSYRITGTVDGQDVLIFADSFSGVPVQVEIGDRFIRYRDLALSSSGVFGPLEG